MIVMQITKRRSYVELRSFDPQYVQERETTRSRVPTMNEEND
jgi:hypothetical protein